MYSNINKNDKQFIVCKKATEVETNLVNLVKALSVLKEYNVL